MKYILLFAAILSLFSCAEQQAEAAGEKNTAAVPATNTAAAVAAQLYVKFNAHDWTGMSALYADTAWFKDPSLGSGMVKQTRAQTVEKYAALQKNFNDIRDSVVAVYPSGDSCVTVEFISKGTAPDGKSFELPICTVFTVENGKITRDFTYYDNF